MPRTKRRIGGGQCTAGQWSARARSRAFSAVTERGLAEPHRERTSRYAAQAKHLLASSQLVAARTAYQRALQLAPDAQTAPALRAQLQFINTELALTMKR